MSSTEELRAMAESVGLAMPQAATLMMGAADAIDRLNSENVKLQEENLILRKYAFTALSALSYCDCCPYVDCCDIETVPMHEGCKAFEELCELGIEVD